MWTCSECNANVEDENSLCMVCGAPRKPAPPHYQGLFSSIDQPQEGLASRGLRHDLACVVVRGFGLYLMFQALVGLPTIIGSIAAASEFEKHLEINAGSLKGNFTSVLIAMVLVNIITFAAGLFLLSSDLTIRLLARPAKY